MLSQERFQSIYPEEFKIILRLSQDYFLEYFRCNDFKILLDPEDFQKVFSRLFQDYFFRNDFKILLSQEGFQSIYPEEFKIILRLSQDYFLEYFRCNDFKILLDPESIPEKYFLYPEDFQKVFSRLFQDYFLETILKYY